METTLLQTKTEGTKERTPVSATFFNGRQGTPSASHNKLECVRSNCGEEDAFERSRVSVSVRVDTAYRLQHDPGKAKDVFHARRATRRPPAGGRPRARARRARRVSPCV